MMRCPLWPYTLLFASLNMAATGAEAQCKPGFELPQQFGVGILPEKIALADVNGDGHWDLASANNGGSITISLGLGPPYVGWFDSPIGIAFPFASSGLTLADFDADGKLDLAYTSLNNSGVYVLCGNGDGTFAERSSYRVGLEPGPIASADFNGDGLMDLAIINTYSDNTVVPPVKSALWILLGDGDGMFQVLEPQFASITRRRSLALADFDHDGNVDAVVGHDFGVAVLRGDGAGGFGAPESYPLSPTTPRTVSVADVNGDGWMDVVSVNHAAFTLSVLMGTGLNSGPCLRSGTEIATNDHPAAVAFADIDEDGRLDLAVATRWAGGSVSVTRGNGDGTFKGLWSFGTGLDPRDILAKDVDLDGHVDLVTADYRSDSASVLRSTLCPTDLTCDGFVDFFDFDAFILCFESGICPPRKTADFDNDGFIDFFDFDFFVTAFETGC